MAAEQTAAELTTRDVLFQVDRRLALIEEDLRGLDGKVEALDLRLDDKIDGLRGEMSTQIGGLRAEFNTRLHSEISGLRNEMTAGFARVDTKFQWQTGLIVGSWFTLMGMMVSLLLK